MLRNLYVTVYRGLLRNSLYTFINLAGLSVGIASCLLISLYLRQELSFDNYHEKKERIYRVVAYGGLGEKSWTAYVAGDPVPEMRASYPGVEDATKIINFGLDRIRLGEDVFRDVKIICAESNLFNIFSFSLTAADPDRVLDKPITAVITQSLARSSPRARTQ